VQCLQISSKRGPCWRLSEETSLGRPDCLAGHVSGTHASCLHERHKWDTIVEGSVLKRVSRDWLGRTAASSREVGSWMRVKTLCPDPFRQIFSLLYKNWPNQRKASQFDSINDGIKSRPRAKKVRPPSDVTRGCVTRYFFTFSYRYTAKNTSVLGEVV